MFKRLFWNTKTFKHTLLLHAMKLRKSPALTKWLTEHLQMTHWTPSIDSLNTLNWLNLNHQVNLKHEGKGLTNSNSDSERFSEWNSLSLPKDSLSHHWFADWQLSQSQTKRVNDQNTDSLNKRQERSFMINMIHALKHWFAEQVRTESRSLTERVKKSTLIREESLRQNWITEWDRSASRSTRDWKIHWLKYWIRKGNMIRSFECDSSNNSKHKPA